MSFAGRAENLNGCATKPKGHGIGLRSCFAQIQSSLLTGSYVMATAEQWEPYESRGSRTVLGEPGGESPPGDSTIVARLIDADFRAAGQCQASQRAPGKQLHGFAFAAGIGHLAHEIFDIIA